MRWTCLLLGLLLCSAFAIEAAAGSAVTYDSPSGVFSYRHGYSSAAAAETAALASCIKRGGKACEIIVSCDAGGHGMVYSRRAPAGGAFAVGASCGATTAAEANEIAKKACNERIKPNSCGGPLGECRCGGPRASWRD